MIDQLTQRAYDAACASLMASLHRDSAPSWDETPQSTRDAYDAVVVAVVEELAEVAAHYSGTVTWRCESESYSPDDGEVSDWLRSLLTETRP